jgi:hypothetical protein
MEKRTAYSAGGCTLTLRATALYFRDFCVRVSGF